MSERYTRLFSLPTNIGQDGCPVLISAGALLKDNNTGKLLVQLKLRNISKQVIKSVKIKVNAYDTAGISLKGVEAFSYLDLAVARDGEFGSKTPVILPDKTTRSVSVEILSVVYGNGEVYQPVAGVVADSVNAETVQIINELDNERTQRQIAVQQKKTEDKKAAMKGFAIVLILIAFLVPIFAICNYVNNKRAEAFRKEADKIMVKLAGTYWRTEDYNSSLSFYRHGPNGIPDEVDYDTDKMLSWTSPTQWTQRPMKDWKSSKYSIAEDAITDMDGEKATLNTRWPTLYIYYTPEEDGSYTLTKIKLWDEVFYPR